MTNIILDSKLLTHGRGNVNEVLTIITSLISRVIEVYPWDSKVRVIVTTDVGKSDYRMSLLPTYKAGRSYGCPIEYAKFKHMYLEGVIPILKGLGVLVLDIPGLEADDQASIMAHKLPPEDLKILVTEDRDWEQIVFGASNTLILSPKTFQFKHRESLFDSTGIKAKSQFIAKKCIRGDAGDAIRPTATLCGEMCQEPFFEEVFSDPKSFAVGTYEEQLEYIKNAYLAYVDKPKHKVHKAYLDVVRTKAEAWDLNVKLGTTMVDLSLLSDTQKFLLQERVENVPNMSSHEFINSYLTKTFPDLEGDFGGSPAIPLSTYILFKELSVNNSIIEGLYD